MRSFAIDGMVAPERVDELEEVPFSSEAELESLLQVNTEVLLDEPLFVFARQPGLDTGIADLLALDQWGNVVVIELKKGQSGSGSASEETILSQPQNYAQSLSTDGYDELDGLYQEYHSDVKDGRWAVDDAALPADELDEAFEQVFGQPLKPAEFNDEQRLVIVAETITRRTEQNARYLLEQGLNIQCVGINRFSGPDDGPEVLTTAVPVDYDLKRVRPEREGVPLYPEVVADVLERTFPRIRSVVDAESYHEVATDLDEHDPYIVSNAPGHPSEVRYSIRPHPLTDGVFRIAIDVVGNDDALETVRDDAGLFERESFDVNHSRGSYRIVTDEWDIASVEPLRDDEFLDQVVSRYVELVKLGHEVFASRT